VGRVCFASEIVGTAVAGRCSGATPTFRALDERPAGARACSVTGVDWARAERVEDDLDGPR
jgi:hypothetical protein